MTMQSRFCPLTVHSCYSLSVILIVRAHGLVCHQNMFFVSYPVAGCVKVFSEDGGCLRSIGMSESDDGQLTLPLGLAIDRFNNLVVCDYVKRPLQIFTVDGKFVNTIEGQHTGLCEPYSVAVSSTGQLFVTDVDRNRLHIFQ